MPYTISNQKLMEDIALRLHSKAKWKEEEKWSGEPQHCPSTFSIGLVVLQIVSLQISAKSFIDCYEWSHRCPSTSKREASNYLYNLKVVLFKGALSALRQFLAIESPLKMMKNAFYFTSKALFVLKIFKFLSWLFGHLVKRLD